MKTNGERDIQQGTITRENESERARKRERERESGEKKKARGEQVWAGHLQHVR